MPREPTQTPNVYAQHLLPCFAPPSSEDWVTRMVSPPDGLMTLSEDSRDLEETMR